jgi:hypothetical protein
MKLRYFTTKEWSKLKRLLTLTEWEKIFASYTSDKRCQIHLPEYAGN